MLEELERDHGVMGKTIVQFLGDAIFIPAGAPHQVRNINSCIKVAFDFVTPQSAEQCLMITNQLRKLDSQNHKEDKLQTKNIVWHSIKECMNEIF